MEPPLQGHTISSQNFDNDPNVLQAVYLHKKSMNHTTNTYSALTAICFERSKLRTKSN